MSNTAANKSFFLIINLFPFSFLQIRQRSIKNAIFIFYNGRKNKWEAKYWSLKKAYSFSTVKKISGKIRPQELEQYSLVDKISYGGSHL